MPAATPVSAPTKTNADGADATTGKRPRATMDKAQLQAKIEALVEQQAKNTDKRLRADQQTTLCQARAKGYAIDMDKYTKLLESDRSAAMAAAEESEEDADDADASRPRKRSKTSTPMTDDEIRAKIAQIVDQQDKNEVKRKREEYKCAYCEAKNKGIAIELDKFRRLLKEGSV